MILTPFIDWPDGLVLLLASASPRRADLLRTAGIPFDVQAAPEVESDDGNGAGAVRDDPVRYAVLLARAKAAAVHAEHPGRLVLGADTVVVLAGEILEKPRDRDEAIEILSRLAGRRHTVITAMALLGGARDADWAGHAETVVDFLPLSREAIERYCDTGEPFDKAGAYGIQGYGAMMVRRVEGCYFNVMGLPLAELGGALREVLGQDVPGGKDGRA